MKITRNKKIISDILKKALVCRIALCDGIKPYIIPVNFGYENGKIYIHTSVNSRKLEIIRRNNNISFEVEIDTEVIPDYNDPCRSTMRYRSVIGWGKAYIVDDPSIIKRALDLITMKYMGKTFENYNEKDLKRTAIIEISIEEMTAKISP